MPLYPNGILLLTPQDSGLIAVSGSAACRIAPDGSTTELGSIAAGIKAASAAQSGDTVWIYATGQGRQGLSLAGFRPTL